MVQIFQVDSEDGIPLMFGDAAISRDVQNTEISWHLSGLVTERQQGRMALLRSALCVVLTGVLFTARPLPSLAETPVSRCVSDLQIKYGASPAFKIKCASQADCEFEPSQPMNAAAMALIDVMAKTVIKCWQDGGLTMAVPVPSPPSLNLSVQRYRAPDEKAPAVCSIAQLKPFGQDKLTTFFRAACDP